MRNEHACAWMILSVVIAFSTVGFRHVPANPQPRNAEAQSAVTERQLIDECMART